MNTKQLEKHDRFSRVRDYSTANPEEFPANSRRSQLLAIIIAAYEEVNTQAAAQAVGLSTAREGTINKKAARDALRKSLEAINRAARTMDAESTGIAEQFRLPHKENDQVMLNTARAFMTNATPIEADLIANELHMDFLAKLGTDTSRLEKMISAKHHQTDMHVTATAAINAALERGLKALRQLDLIMRNLFQFDSVKLTAWKSASRAERHTRKQVPEPPPAPTSAP